MINTDTHRESENNNNNQTTSSFFLFYRPGKEIKNKTGYLYITDHRLSIPEITKIREEGKRKKQKRKIHTGGIRIIMRDRGERDGLS
jgi:hypothetical protein